MIGQKTDQDTGDSEAKENFSNNQDHGKEDSEALEGATQRCSNQEENKKTEDMTLVQELGALISGEIKGDMDQGIVKTTMSMTMKRTEMIMAMMIMEMKIGMMEASEIRGINLKEVCQSKEVEENKCSMGKASRGARIQIDLDNQNFWSQHFQRIYVKLFASFSISKSIEINNKI